MPWKNTTTLFHWPGSAAIALEISCSKLQTDFQYWYTSHCQAGTIGNTFASWKWPQKQNICEVVLCWPSGDCNNASLSVWFALPITQNMVIDQPPKKYICKDICTDLSIRSFSWCALPIRDAFWTFGRDFRPLWRHLLGYYEICSPFWTWVWPPPPLEQCEKTARLIKWGIPYQVHRHPPTTK